MGILKDYDNEEKKILDILRLSTCSFNSLAKKTRITTKEKSELTEFMLSELKNRKIPFSEFTYNAAISAFASAQNSERVLDLFFEMQGEELEPDLITYVYVIPEYYKQGDYEEALNLMDRTIRHGMFRGNIQDGKLNLNIESVYPEKHKIRSIDNKNYIYLVSTILLLNERNNKLFNLTIETRNVEVKEFTEQFLRNHGYMFASKNDSIRTFGPIQLIPVYYPTAGILPFGPSPADW